LHSRTMKIVVALTLGMTLTAAPAVARKGDVLPPKGKSILFWTPAEQAVGYRSMEDVGPVAVIKRGGKVRPLPHARGPEPLITFSYGGKSYDTDSYMKAYNVSGILIVKDGRILLERYGLGRTPKDRWTSFSVAKSVTSTLVGAAIKDGYIKSVNDPVVNYIPDLKGSAYEGVTVRHLLTMTSGVRWNEDYTDPNSDVARAGQEPATGGVNPIVAYMKRLPREAAPGSTTRPARPTSPASWSPAPPRRRWRTTPPRRSGDPTAWSRTASGCSTAPATSAAAAA
jgi:hypothetical protein